MQTIVHLPEIFADDSRRFAEEIQRLNSGEISFTQFRSYRVPLGVYEQREADTYMLRVRFPAGGVLPPQMRVLADASRKYGNGVLHVTTRQDIQIHRVLIDDVPPAFTDLWAAGLSTRGGGGNTVRNIVGCHNAGVCRGELFDVSPHAVALTEFLLPDPLSYQLPRKYKIALAGCGNDCPGATVNDVGLIARRRNGSTGFAVYVGGGMGASSRVADPFEEFVPAEEIHLVAEAVKRVFDKHGNRKNRHKARLRFLMDKIGVEGFRELYEGEMAELRKSPPPGLEVRPLPPCERAVPAGETQPAEQFAAWRRRNVVPQKQEGYHLVQVFLPLGDIAADTLEKLADVAEQHGEGMVRTTQWQNLVIRWVHENELADLHAKLDALGLAQSEPPVLRDMIACAGASTCKLGIGLARGLAGAVRDALLAGDFDLHGLGELKIYISGCPNSCGRHPIGDVGLFGAARRVEGRLVPHYVLQLGGKVAEGETRLAEGKQTVPARNVPALLVELLEAFGRSEQCPDFAGFLQAQGLQLADALAAKYRDVPDFQEDRNYYYDWGAEELFSLAGRGPGECGAGIFDMIEVDMASARDAVGEQRLFDATVLAARCLLVTRGQEGRDASQVLELFTQFFLDEKLVDDCLRPLIERAQQAAKTPQPADAFTPEPADVSRLVETIVTLYDNMDPSLRFRPAGEESPPAEAESAAETAETAAPAEQPEITREADFRGVVCPLNYVKTKMVLDRLGSGDVLSILLDEAGAKNVPESVEKDGHDVLSVAQEASHWRVVVRKA